MLFDCRLWANLGIILPVALQCVTNSYDSMFLLHSNPFREGLTCVFELFNLTRIMLYVFLTSPNVCFTPT